jgi:hypothetical protein
VTLVGDTGSTAVNQTYPVIVYEVSSPSGRFLPPLDLGPPRPLSRRDLLPSRMLTLFSYQEEALRFERIHEDTYRNFGFEIVQVNPGILSERVAAIKAAI